MFRLRKKGLVAFPQLSKKKVAIWEKKFYGPAVTAVCQPETENFTAENLRQIRIARGLTQTQVGEILGIAKDQVCKIEAGSRSLSHAERLVLDAAILNQPIAPIRDK